MDNPLFIPFKAVGFVTDGRPFAINRLGGETFVTVSVGQAFQVFRFAKLTVCLVSRPIPNIGDATISSIQVKGTETFCTVENKIYVFNRTEIVRVYDQHETSITGTLLMGPLLLTYDTTNSVYVIDIKDREKRGHLSVLQSDAQISCLMHPATYINKVVIGLTNGHLELWNVRKKTVIHSFTCHLDHFRKTASRPIVDLFGNQRGSEQLESCGSSDEAFPEVSCIEQSPATDVVAIGFSSGDILLVNLKLDVVLFGFKQTGGKVTSCSFRTDVNAQTRPYMASGSSDGRIHIWNLGTVTSNGMSSDIGGSRANAKTESDSESDSESDARQGSAIQGRQLASTLEAAHSLAVSKIHFLFGEPILLSASADNSIKVWIFDAPDGSARLLRSREGHQGHPLRLRYYGGSTNVSMRDNAEATSCEILSSGSDGSLRLFNTAIEAQNRELSQKPILQKLGLLRRNQRLPRIVDMDFSETRARDWANCITAHDGHSSAYLWKYKNRIATDIQLRQPHWSKQHEKTQLPDSSTHATAVCMSPCGNSTAVGTKSGVIYLYNVQSGLPRGSLPPDATPQMKAGKKRALAATPGNVLHERRRIMGLDANMHEATGNHAGSLAVSGKDAVSVEDIRAQAQAQAQAQALAQKHTPTRHIKPISGLFVDMSSSVLVSAGRDGYLLFWDLLAQPSQLIRAVQHAYPLMRLCGFRDANFLAVADEAHVMRIYDVSSGRLARRFEGHTRAITDMAFSADGRRFLSASMDSSVRVFDMLTGRCLSWMQFSAPVVSMSISLSGEFLAVSQIDKEGIYLYLDRSLYETVHFWKEPTTPTPIDDSKILAESSGEADLVQATSENGATAESEQEQEDAVTTAQTDKQGAGELIQNQNENEKQNQCNEEVGQRGQKMITMAALVDPR